MSIELKKLAPWNWFKHEDEQDKNTIKPVDTQGHYQPLTQIHREFDRLFDSLSRQFGWQKDNFVGTGELLKPSVDIAATGPQYTITVEIPGVDESNISLELLDNSLVLKGEKKQEKEEKGKEFYRIERSYGRFQRVLALPEDVDQEHIDAHFKNGVLTISLQRKALVEPAGRRVEIKGRD